MLRLQLTPTRKTIHLSLPSVGHKSSLETSEPAAVHHHHQKQLDPTLHPDSQLLLPLFTYIWITGGNQPQNKDGYPEQNPHYTGPFSVKIKCEKKLCAVSAHEEPQ